MRVTQIISDTGIGGGGRCVLSYLASCDRENFPPSVILPKNSELVPFIQELGVEYMEIDGMYDVSYDKKAFAPMKKALRELNPELVHTHGSLVGRMVAKTQGRKVLYTKHCAFPPTGWKKSLVGKAMVSTVDKLLSDGVIAVGHAGEQILKDTGISPQRIHMMYNGVSPLAKPSTEEKIAQKKAYGFGAEDFVVGILARIEEYKGHEILVEAVAKLLAEDLPVKLLVCGEGQDMPRIQALAQEKIKEHVHFTGFLSQITCGLYAMDVQVNASTISENCSMSLLEGMSMGLPAVVSEIGGNGYLIHHEVNGLCCPVRDSQALADGIRRLYQDRVFYEKLSQGAEEIFSQEFTGTQYGKKIEAVYMAL